MSSQKRLKIAVSVGAVAVMVARFVWPNLKVDVFTLALVIVALLPWLSGMIESAKFPGGWEVKFREQVDQLAKSIDVGVPAAEATQNLKDIRTTALLQVSEAPAISIVEAWRLVENALVELAARTGTHAAAPVWTMPLLLGAMMLGDRTITDSQYDAMKRIKGIRDAVIHARIGEPSIADARTVIDLAIQLMASLSAASVRGNTTGGKTSVQESHSRAG
jgi:hypothetical protein